MMVPYFGFHNSILFPFGSYTYMKMPWSSSAIATV
jgi:hypothetical protein